MAISKLMNIKNSKSHTKKAGKHLINALEYICNPEKTRGGLLISGINCPATARGAYVQFMKTKAALNSNGNRQAYHFILSCEEDEGNPELMMKLTKEFLEEYLKNEYEVLYTVHDNTKKLHSHIIFNSVNFKTGKKYHYETGEWERNIQAILNKICEKHGLNTLDIEECRKEKQKECSHRKRLKEDLDEAIEMSKSYDEFLNIMSGKNYKIKYGKYLGMKSETGKIYIRVKSVGELYSEEMIKLRIALNGGEMKKYNYNYRKKIKAVRANWNFIKKVKYKNMSPYQKWVLKKYLKQRKIKNCVYAKNTYKYRDDIKKLGEAQEEYYYIIKNDIRSPLDLPNKLNEVKKEKMSIAVERKKFNLEGKIYEGIVKKYERLMELEDKYIIYEHDGTEVFKEAYDEYTEIKKEIAELGLDIGEIKEYMKDIYNKKEEFKVKNADIGKKIKIIERLIKKNRLDGLYYIEEMKTENLNENGIYGSFEEWSSSRLENSYTFDRAFNHTTENDYSRDNYYIVCDRLHPDNFIRVKSERDYYQGEEYTKSYYTVYAKEKKVMECDDGQFDERERSYWFELKKEMKEASGMEDDNIIFENEENFKKYLEAYKAVGSKHSENTPAEKPVLQTGGINK